MFCMNTAPFLWKGGAVSWKVLGGSWMGGFNWAFCCKLSIWYLKMRSFTLCLNLTFRIEQERPSNSETTMSPKISFSHFCIFFWENCWLFLTIWHHIWPVLISSWAFSRAGHGCNHLSSDRSLWYIWLYVWHSTCIVISNCRHSSFSSSSSLLLSMLSSSFFQLLLVSFFSFRKWLSQSRKL